MESSAIDGSLLLMYVR